MKQAIVWRRILNEGLTGAEYLDDIDGSPDYANNLILTSKIIVDTRKIERPSNDWESFRHVCFPFDRFWVEGASCGVFYGAMVILVKSDRDPEATTVVMSCVMAKPDYAPTLIGQASFEWTAKEGISSKVPIINLSPPVRSPNPAVTEDASNTCAIVAYATLETLLMLSCKNVALEPRDNDAKQVRRAVKRQGGKPEDYRYHVLVVRPPGAKSTTPGVELGTMPRHFARAHFAEYGPQFGKGLLFGKLSGRFYVPPHFRGRKENGTVEKDYKVA